MIAPNAIGLRSVVTVWKGLMYSKLEAYHPCCRYGGYITCTKVEKANGVVTSLEANFEAFDGRKPPKVVRRQLGPYDGQFLQPCSCCAPDYY
jgi:hypothetical protein